MDNHTMTFDHTELGTKLLAIYVSTLIAQGVTFHIVQGNTATTVELTGGF